MLGLSYASTELRLLGRSHGGLVKSYTESQPCHLPVVKDITVSQPCHLSVVKGCHNVSTLPPSRGQGVL